MKTDNRQISGDSVMVSKPLDGLWLMPLYHDDWTPADEDELEYAQRTLLR